MSRGYPVRMAVARLLAPPPTPTCGAGRYSDEEAFIWAEGGRTYGIDGR